MANLDGGPGGVDPLTVQWITLGMLADATRQIRVDKNPQPVQNGKPEGAKAQPAGAN